MKHETYDTLKCMICHTIPCNTTLWWHSDQIIRFDQIKVCRQRNWATQMCKICVLYQNPVFHIRSLFLFCFQIAFYSIGLTLHTTPNMLTTTAVLWKPPTTFAQADDTLFLFEKCQNRVALTRQSRCSVFIRALYVSVSKYKPSCMSTKSRSLYVGQAFSRSFRDARLLYVEPFRSYL